MRKYLFIDRDGTLIEEPPDRQVDSLEKFRLMPGVIPALLTLREAGYRFVLVSNQDGLGTASFPHEHYEPPQRLMMDTLASQGIEFEAVRVCPHFESDGCECRKPRPGLLMDYLRDTGWSRQASAVIGDRDTDMALAVNIGVRGVRIGAVRGWPEAARELLGSRRRANVARSTKETAVRVNVDLDASSPVKTDTGIGFFDHMLEQLAVHGGFALEAACEGDLHVDEHHTVEDVALALGEAISRALGDRRGIGRYGFLLPMDESRARVALDLSGRPYCVFEGEFPRERVGGLSTELVPHFWRSLSQSLGAAIHVGIEGDNAHHMVEATFKGVGRALRQALRREDGDVPSTKGVL